MRLLLMTPPMTQLNTPYPATAYLKGFLRKHRPDIQVIQEDPALELVLRLFSRKGLSRVREVLQRDSESSKMASAAVRFFLNEYDAYERAVEPALRFLQGKDPSLALRICSRQFLPEGPSFDAFEQYGALTEPGGDELGWAFGGLGVQDRAKYLASLFLDDLAAVIRDGVDSRFAFTRYGEKLSASQASFDPLEAALRSSTPTLVDVVLDEITDEIFKRHTPDLVGMTAPFPGNVYGAFRMASKIREIAPQVKCLLGGGYPNTELRELQEPRVFDYFDFVILDDGERPLLTLLEHLEGKRSDQKLCRTFFRSNDGARSRVVFSNDPSLHDIPHREVGTPDYEGLPLDRYLSILEMLNPMHRVWSDGRWNKLTLAHGCYWKKCSFCDVSLDYIGRYDPASADLLIDRMIEVSRQTGQTGFHFVDEAAPPSTLKNLSMRLIERGESFTWWGNVRFDQAFTPELAGLMARAGCVAVSGGLEAASDRLLKLMNKGVSVEQVARVTKAFSDAGIFVHAYLMYGFPSQTEEETLEALERVRQLFEAGCIQSAFWHRFSTTVHSPVGREPSRFGVKITEKPLETGVFRFARNDLPFEDSTVADHEWLGDGLRRALYNYMHGIGLDQDVRSWFVPRQRNSKMRKVKVSADLIQRALS
jgi:radical SAM superfamily enzyme YgiQ (UPF0313 family)